MHVFRRVLVCERECMCEGWGSFRAFLLLMCSLSLFSPLCIELAAPVTLSVSPAFLLHQVKKESSGAMETNELHYSPSKQVYSQAHQYDPGLDLICRVWTPETHLHKNFCEGEIRMTNNM